MSGIYGSLRHYSPDLVALKTKQLEYRGTVQILNTASNDITVVLDGAVYNQNGAEDLVEQYKQHGVDCLKYLNGDFAFVLYDPVAQRLFGAVDRVGAKPLYYSLQGGFEFSSHLLPLCIGNSYSVDTYARQCYFAMQYVPAPYSMVSEV